MTSINTAEALLAVLQDQQKNEAVRAFIVQIIR